MEEEFVVEYFKNIATKLKDLAHTEEKPTFYYIKNIIDMSAITSKISTFNEGPILLLENHEGGIGSTNGDNDFEKIFGAFTILIPATSNDEDEDFKTLFGIVHSIAIKIFSKLQNDSIEGILDYFSFEFNYMKVGPVSDNRYGRRYEFSIGKSIEIKFDNDDWLD